LILAATGKLLHREHASLIEGAHVYREIESTRHLTHEVHGRRWLWHSWVKLALFIHLIHVSLLLLVEVSIAIASLEILVWWHLSWVLMAKLLEKLRNTSNRIANLS
jgi:hypothetical protein